MHSINYRSTFIEVSPDTRATAGMIPPKPGTIAALQYEMLCAAPYTLTSDDLLTRITAVRTGRTDEESAVRAELFCKGQACLRTSPLVKTYGWGVHHDDQARVALVSFGSPEYERLLADENVRKIKGLKSRR